MENVRGERVGRSPRASRMYPARRACSVAGCGTRLSIYNPDAACWRHTPVSFVGSGRESRAA